MSRDAVKFGRMSKKQRERVEDEANMVKATQMGECDELASLCFSPLPAHDHQQFFSVSDSQTPTVYTHQPNGCSYQPASHSPICYNTQLPSPLTDVFQDSSRSCLAPPSTAADTAPLPVAAVLTADLLDPVALGSTISDAFLRTCLYSGHQIAHIRQQATPQEIMDNYRSMSYRQLWCEVAERMTLAVQQIIEFAKMIPGFMDLSQDDQIMLLKAGSFELALLQTCRVFDLSTNSIILGCHFVPLDALSSFNSEEKLLIGRIFGLIKSLLALSITETEMALLSAFILICSDRPGVRQLHIVQKLHEKIFSALKLEIGNNHVDHEDVLSQFVHHACLLRSLSQHHLALLSRFKGENPDVDFPPLHQELFSLDPTDNT